MWSIKDISVRAFVLLLVLTVSGTFFTSCVPFSEFQGARLLGPKNFEVTPSYSTVSVTSEGETQHIHNNFGVQAGFGALSFMDLRVRYERISGEIVDEDEDFRFNVVEFGPKFRLYKDWLAVYVPVGFAFEGDMDTSETWHIKPTVLGTWPINKNFEVNPSAKIIIPFNSDDFDTFYAFNLGLAISTDVQKWAVRPEIGICTNFEGGHFMHFSVGFSLSSKLFKR